jgi:hypothetical protein
MYYNTQINAGEKIMPRGKKRHKHESKPKTSKSIPISKTVIEVLEDAKRGYADNLDHLDPAKKERATKILANPTILHIALKLSKPSFGHAARFGAFHF